MFMADRIALFVPSPTVAVAYASVARLASLLFVRLLLSVFSRLLAPVVSNLLREGGGGRSLRSVVSLLMDWIRW